jgi:UV DNA damage repair endonuclease
MTTKQILLQQIENFINEICTIFPNSNEMLLLREKFTMIKSMNSKIIIEYIIRHIYPLKQMILEQNEEFFLNGGGQEEIKDNSGLRFRDNIRKLWMTEMIDENKEIVWKYFKVFVILSDKYIKEE